MKKKAKQEEALQEGGREGDKREEMGGDSGNLGKR